MATQQQVCQAAALTDEGTAHLEAVRELRTRTAVVQTAESCLVHQGATNLQGRFEKAEACFQDAIALQDDRHGSLNGSSGPPQADEEDDWEHSGDSPYGWQSLLGRDLTREVISEPADCRSRLKAGGSYYAQPGYESLQGVRS